MRLKSIETTPNPNSMKLNLDDKVGKAITYTVDSKDDCPEFIADILKINGVKSVFACNDFVTLNRDPLCDWKIILGQATLAFETASDSKPVSGVVLSDKDDAEVNALRQAAQKDGQIEIFVQTFKGIPIQVKATAGLEQIRVSLGERFDQLAKKIQAESGADFLKERYWADYGLRYGDVADMANEVADEIRGTFGHGSSSNSTSGTSDLSKISNTADFDFDAIKSQLKNVDWHLRLAAVQILSERASEIDLLIQALQDESPQVRRLAAAALGAAGKSEAVPALSKTLVYDAHIGVRRTAGDALSDIGDPSAQGAMCQALSDPNKLVRWRAARFLSDLANAESLPYLEGASDDSAFEVRLEIEAAKQRIAGGGQGMGPAWRRIVESHQGLA